MATIQKFEDVLAWQKCREFHNKVWVFTNRLPFSKDFEHRNQLNASSGSAMDLIAEGFGRGGNREFVNFLSMASGSLAESKSQLYRALDKGYITSQEFDSSSKLCSHAYNLTSALIRRLNQSQTKGLKFKTNT